LVSRRKTGRRGAPSTYELTRQGRSLAPVLQALHDWGVEAAPSLGVTIEGLQLGHRGKP
jgi:DNA-binding HxlR family transcriptional regulator